MGGKSYVKIFDGDDYKRECKSFLAKIRNVIFPPEKA